MTSSTSSSERHPAATALAVLGPLAVLGAWWVAFSGPEPFEKSDFALEHEATLAEEQPRLVVMGNSASWRGVDGELLADELGIPGEVTRIFVAASRSPAWYAMLRNRIVANGHKPQAVVVVAPLLHMLDMSTNPDRRQRLESQLTPDDEVVRQKVYGDEPVFKPLERSRAAARSLVEVPREALVGAVFDDHADLGWLEGGRVTADEAADEVFDIETSADLDLHRRILPVASVPTRAERSTDDVVLDPEATLIREMAAVAREAGIRLVFVRFPLPSTSVEPGVTPELARQTVAMLREVGVGWVDLHQLDVPDAAYFDNIHMNDAGRRQFTRALAEGLTDVGVLGDRMRPAAVPVTFTRVERVGTPPPLPAPANPRPLGKGCQVLLDTPGVAGFGDTLLYKAIGVAHVGPIRLLVDGAPAPMHVPPPVQACDDTAYHLGPRLVFAPGERGVEGRALTLDWEPTLPIPGKSRGNETPGWWVYPGTTLRFHMAAADDPGEPWVLRATAALVGSDRRDGLVVEAAGQQARFDVAGRLVEAELPFDGPGSAWTIDVRSEGEAALLLDELVVGPVSAPTAMVDMRTMLVSTFRFLGSNVPNLEVEASGEPPVLEVVGPFRGPQPEGISVQRVSLPGAEELLPLGIAAKTNARQCSPVRLLEDGESLGEGFLNYAQMVREGRRGALAQGSAVMFTASDDTDPESNGRTYTAALDRDRFCRGNVWLYPGDAVEVRFPSVRMASGALGQLQLSAALYAGDPAAGSLGLQVEADGVLVHEGSVPFTALDGRIATVALDTPVPLDALALVVRLSSTPGSPYALVTSASLDVVSGTEEGPGDTDTP